MFFFVFFRCKVLLIDESFKFIYFLKDLLFSLNQTSVFFGAIFRKRLIAIFCFGSSLIRAFDFRHVQCRDFYWLDIHISHIFFRIPHLMRQLPLFECYMIACCVSFLIEIQIWFLYMIDQLRRLDITLIYSLIQTLNILVKIGKRDEFSFMVLLANIIIEIRLLNLKLRHHCFKERINFEISIQNRV